MQRFFFDFCQGTERCPDAEGTEFANVEQAYLEAFKAAQDMWSEFLRQRQDPRRCVFEVRNDQRELLFALPFHEVMDSCRDREPPCTSASSKLRTRPKRPSRSAPSSCSS